MAKPQKNTAYFFKGNNQQNRKSIRMDLEGIAIYVEVNLAAIILKRRSTIKEN
jgi:hypothetical protein